MINSFSLFGECGGEKCFIKIVFMNKVMINRIK